jgi:putative ABC transport system permease protein
MTIGNWIRLGLRESRGAGGRLLFFAACLAVGVAAVVAVAGLSRALDDGIQARAKTLLAADVSVESRRPIEPEILRVVDGLEGVRRARVVEMASVVAVPRSDEAAPGPSVLCEIKVVEPGYPFYGAVATTPDAPLEALLDRDHVLVGPEVLRRLDTRIGETIRIGNESFRIAGTVSAEPDRLDIGFTVGPRVLMAYEGLERSGLLVKGSRVSHSLLIRHPDGTPRTVVDGSAEAIRSVLADPEFTRVETADQAQPVLRQGLDQVARFLGLVALLSLLVGGIGVAQAVRAWLAGRLHGIAVMRALGVRPREIFGLYLGQASFLALVGSGTGAVIGSLAAMVVPRLLEGLLPVTVTVGWQPAAIVRGIGLGLAVALLFSLRPLVDAVRVPPVRVLRQDADPLPLSRAASVGLAAVLLVGIASTAVIQSGSLVRGTLFAAGMVVAAAALTAGAWLVMRLVASTPRRRGPISLRHGLAALARPGAGTLGAVVALGLGVVTVLGMHLVQVQLSAELDADLPTGAPTAFLVDIQTDQWPAVQRALADAGASAVNSADVVVARLREISGRPIADLVADAGSSEEQRWVFTREQRLSTLAELPEDNVIVAGEFWSHPDRAEVSVEQGFATDLGVEVGDTLVFDVQGVELDVLVSSIRTVDWGGFTINFFLAMEPGVLDGAPGFLIATARIPAEAEMALQDRLAATVPNVTLIRLREILETVVSVLEQVGLGVRLLGAFTVLAGIAILGGAISAQTVRRGREVALLKTLGMTRAQVASGFAVEYALVGAVAGLIGTVGGVVLAWAVTRYGMRIDWAWTPLTYLLSVGATVALSVIAGLAASIRPLNTRPLTALRR